MKCRSLKLLSLALPLTLVSLSGCSDDATGVTGSFSGGGTGTSETDSDSSPTDSDSNSGSESESDSNSGDGDGDPATATDTDSAGDGDGDTETDSAGDGDGDTSGDGDGDEEPPCTSNDECVDPALPICEEGLCLPCTPEQDVCDIGQYCTEDNICEIGCLEDLDCPEDLICDVGEHTCTGCVEDLDCPLGSVCEDGDCVAGCTDEQPCQDGFSCCDMSCEDLASDPNNCGECGNVCPDFPNAEDLCIDGTCGMGDCEGNWNDCNGDPVDGCETQAQCACVPGESISCYTGFPNNTEGVGECIAGERTCNDQGTGYGACVGQIIPQLEICGSGLDENCDGQVDENPDFDNDGWGACDNDCCDQVSPDCSTPDLVNPGAFEVDGNDVDDDCDGQVDNPVPLCDGGLASNSNNAADYARAIDLCQFTVENPPLPSRIWGVIDTDLRRANDTGAPNANSRSIRSSFGQNNVAQNGNNFAVMSSGYAAAPGQNNPAHNGWEPGNNMTGQEVSAPPDWLALNPGNTFPNAPGCSISNDTTAYDSVMLKLRVRVPTNANSFSAKMYFLSAEYPEYVCTAFNDFFVTLVDPNLVPPLNDNNPPVPDNPADKNIAVYIDDNDVVYPVGVNLVSAVDGLFTECDNGTIGCFGNPQNYNGCTSENGLLGTGFDAAAAACNGNDDVGGGTGWLQMAGNVTPGAVMEIRFAIWDTADGSWDSTVFLDDWQWSVQAAEPGVEPG